MVDRNARRRALLDRIEQPAFVTYNLEKSDVASIRYLTGFTGEGTLLLTPQDCLLLTDSRYTEQAQRETDGVTVEETRQWLSQGLFDALQKRDVQMVAFPATRASHHWVQSLDKADAEFVAIKDVPLELRAIKDEEELNCLRRAAKIADAALEELLPEIRVGMSEADVALKLEWLIRQGGAEHIAFDVNASAGPNTALNHYNPFLGSRDLQSGDFLLLDFGACVDGYRSDITRTLCVGPASDESKDIYDLVLRANLAAIDAAGAGKTGESIDAVARDLIAGEGHAEHFGHGLGHGIGLEVHEAPRLAPRITDEIKPGMVFTIEPGVYLPGIGGVRIEDDVVATASGLEIITHFPKEHLIEVGVQ